MTELLPCPFCGFSVFLHETKQLTSYSGHSKKQWHVQHTKLFKEVDNTARINCILRNFYTIKCDTKEEAVALWNTRTPTWQPPEGWILVPKEPTEEMIKAVMPTEFIGHPEVSEERKRRWFFNHEEARRDDYKKLIAAAPLKGE